MNWTDVKVGDTVTVKTKDVTLTGPLVRWWRLRNDVVQFDVGGFTVFSNESELIEHKPCFRDGDIGIIFNGDGGYFIGAYDSKRDKFYANDAPWNNTAEFNANSTYEITIIGNVKDYA